jgi:GH15 family glucan-1,4-alpha-glucosidase
MWEVRGGRKHFTHSKMMAWVAFDRAVKLVEECGCAADEHRERWQRIRDQVHAEVCERGYNVEKKAFTQYFGSDALDASLLLMPLTGFLPITDERVRGTIEAIERELVQDGLVLRYRPQEEKVDGLPGREGVFSSLFFLAGRLFAFARPEKRSARVIRTLAQSAKRPWSSLRRIRSPRKASARQFPASLFARRAH